MPVSYTHLDVYKRQVPDLADVQTMLALLASIGAEVQDSGGQVQISANRLVPTAPYDLVRKMRASFLVMGPLLVRCCLLYTSRCV